LGAKALDYKDFLIMINIIQNKEHLSFEGINRIKEISSKMNSNRTNFDN
jgi:hypothetical protein